MAKFSSISKIMNQEINQRNIPKSLKDGDGVNNLRIDPKDVAWPNGNCARESQSKDLKEATFSAIPWSTVLGNWL
jgi:hypothetical protein